MLLLLPPLLDSDLLEPHATWRSWRKQRHLSNTNARASSAARSRSAVALPRRGWQLESMMMEDEQAMSAMSSALEKLLRATATEPAASAHGW